MSIARKTVESQKQYIIQEIEYVREHYNEVAKEDLLTILFKLEKLLLEEMDHDDDFHHKEDLTVEETAELFGVTPQAVYKWIDKGKITYKQNTPTARYLIPKSQFHLMDESRFDKTKKKIWGSAEDVRLVDPTDI